MLKDTDALLDDARSAQEREAAMHALRAGLTPVAFNDGFTDRVMARLTASQSPVDALPRMFAQVAPLALAATLLLAAMNLFNTRASHQPVLDRVLGLPMRMSAATPSFDDDLSRWGVGAR